MTASREQKKTPQTATAFEREQLRFFMAQVDVAATLTELNPSLAWLPVLAELRLIDVNTRLAPWIEKNFSYYHAVSEVAANLHFFSPETADLLDFRLSRTADLPPLLLTSWRLIIRFMRNSRRIGLRSEWYDIAPRIKSGEQSAELLERLAEMLRPRLKVGKLFRIGDKDAGIEPTHPTDLMSIDYVVAEGIDSTEILSAWPGGASVEVMEKLLALLTHALVAALEDATEVGVEGAVGSGISDSDVPSVAKHGQNAYREGFQSIVRVIADFWVHLAQKDPKIAREFVETWRVSRFRLLRRLALFAAADATVSGRTASDILLELPSGELFLTGSSVEVCRLLETRWQDLHPKEQEAIQRRLAEGPPVTWFRRDADRHVERCRFDLLAHLERIGVQLAPDAGGVLKEIRRRWPEWTLRPRERAGFHVWHESTSGVIGNSAKLDGVTDKELVAVAMRVTREADLLEGDAWRALCEADPTRALRGLAADASADRWEAQAWHSFLWASTKEEDTEVVSHVVRLLLQSSRECFAEIAKDAAWWLNQNANLLPNDVLWPLWDRIFELKPREGEDISTDDVLSLSINHPAGWLPEIVLKRLTHTARDGELPEALRARLDSLFDAPGSFGRLARARLAREVSFLFERAPKWTTDRLVPLFDWASADADAAWSARRYANYIGSPELIGLLKQPFLDLFARSDMSSKELQIYAGWLVAISIANQTCSAEYPISFAEVRSALRKSGARSLSTVGHRLAVEMGSAAPQEKVAHWRDVVGPVFGSIWPLDVELQTAGSTFQLVHILRSSGSAFPEAADKVIPFIRPDVPGQQSSVYALAKADEVLYSSSPARMLDLLTAVVGDAPVQGVYGLGKALERISKYEPPLRNSKKFQRLLSVT